MLSKTEHTGERVHVWSERRGVRASGWPFAKPIGLSRECFRVEMYAGSVATGDTLATFLRAVAQECPEFPGHSVISGSLGILLTYPWLRDALRGLDA